MRKRADVRERMAVLNEDGAWKYNVNEEVAYLLPPVLTKPFELGWLRYKRKVTSWNPLQFELELVVIEDEEALRATEEGERVHDALLGRGADPNWEASRDANEWTGANFRKWFDFNRETYEVTLKPEGRRQRSFAIFQRNLGTMVRSYGQARDANFAQARREGWLAPAPAPAPLPPAAGPSGPIARAPGAPAAQSDSEPDEGDGEEDDDDAPMAGAGRADVAPNLAVEQQQNEQARAQSGFDRANRAGADGPDSLNRMQEDEFLRMWQHAGYSRAEAEAQLRYRREQEAQGNLYAYGLDGQRRPLMPPPSVQRPSQQDADGDEVMDDAFGLGPLAPEPPMPGGQ